MTEHASHSIVLPVPAALTAQPTLGDVALRAQLEELTQPEIITEKHSYCPDNDHDILGATSDGGSPPRGPSNGSEVNVVDYKTGDLKKQLREACPKGVDVYFDNVGGEILDTVLTQLAFGARIGICGAISQYNNTTPMKGPSNYMSLLVNRATMKGFVVFDYTARYGEALREMGTWMAQGKLKSREDVVEGLETFPETLLKLFRGENLGKLVLKVADA